MNWILSSAARAGLGPPEWIVAAILVAFLVVGAFELRGTASEYQGLSLTRKQKWAATAMVVPLVMLIALLAWRQLIR